jgi:hypothetical protein
LLLCGSPRHLVSRLWAPRYVAPKYLQWGILPFHRRCRPTRHPPLRCTRACGAHRRGRRRRSRMGHGSQDMPERNYTSTISGHRARLTRLRLEILHQRQNIRVLDRIGKGHRMAALGARLTKNLQTPDSGGNSPGTRGFFDAGTPRANLPGARGLFASKGNGLVTP